MTAQEFNDLVEATAKKLSRERLEEEFTEFWEVSRFSDQSMIDDLEKDFREEYCE